MSGSQPAIRSLATALALVATLPAAAQTVDFRAAAPGAPPAGFEFATTGSGPQGRWEAVRDASAAGGTALAQLSTDATSYRFPIALHATARAANVEVTARFKPISGKVDQAGGLVVRYRDPNNYYVARANALENNVRFYRVVQGKREQLATADVKVAPGEWHRLAVRAEGDRFTVSFNGKVLYGTSDQTFGAAGKVGLWTKADSVTHFDTLDIKIPP
jgi:hypothetical protein